MKSRKKILKTYLYYTTPRFTPAAAPAVRVRMWGEPWLLVGAVVLLCFWSYSREGRRSPAVRGYNRGCVAVAVSAL